MTEGAPYRSAAFDPVAHDLSQITSGESDLDAWLRDHAAAAARARVAQTFVWTESDGARVLAYYAISAHAVPRVEAPSRIARGVPNPVPAALLVKLALDRSCTASASVTCCWPTHSIESSPLVNQARPYGPLSSTPPLTGEVRSIRASDSFRPLAGPIA